MKYNYLLLSYFTLSISFVSMTYASPGYTESVNEKDERGSSIIKGLQNSKETILKGFHSSHF